MSQVNEASLLQAREMEKALLRKTKKELLPIYCRTCLGRVHSAKGVDLNKAQMAYDICRARFGKAIAEAALL